MTNENQTQPSTKAAALTPAQALQLRRQQQQAANANKTGEQAENTALQLTAEEQEIKARVESGNEIFKIILAQGDSDSDRAAKIAKVVEYLTAGVENGTAKATDLDSRHEALVDFNAYVQIARKSLAKQQAFAITDKAYADLQKIMNDTSNDLDAFKTQLAPLTQLAGIFEQFGTDGDIFAKIKQAREQKKQREEAEVKWQAEHEQKLKDLQMEIDRLAKVVEQKDNEIRERSAAFNPFGRQQTLAFLTQEKTQAAQDLAERRTQLATAEAETSESALDAMKANVDQADESILKLQDISGEPFQKKVQELRDLAVQTIDRLDQNFAHAISGLENTGSSFVQMGRNCSNADFMLSVLEVAVRQSEGKVRAIAQSRLETQAASGENVDADMARLDVMQKQREGQQFMDYSNNLGESVSEIASAISSLRTSQTTLQNMLKMNSSALKSAKQSRGTGISNTAESVTVTIGSIIQACLRGTNSMLGTALKEMKGDVEAGNIALMEGIDKDLDHQNAEMRLFIESLINLKSITQDMAANSVGKLQEQLGLLSQMREESQGLSDATAAARQSELTARSTVTTTAPAPQASRPATGPKQQAVGGFFGMGG